MSRASSHGDHLNDEVARARLELDFREVARTPLQQVDHDAGDAWLEDQPAMLCRQTEVSSWHETDLNYEAENVW